MIGRTVSHFKIFEKLGEGGMGVVYKAQDLMLDRPVALKFLPQRLTEDADAKKRFVREAKAASALDHANICTVYEIDETRDGQMFIAMAYYEGESLKKRLDRRRPKITQALDITSQVASGLSKAHEKGIVHRDIKPANILLTEDGHAKLADFGIAKLAGRTRMTKTGATVGTVAYMSPEQASGQDVDHRSDIFSLGVVLYEMLTGDCPFQGDHEAAVVYSIVHAPAPPLSKYWPDVPDSLQHIIDKALQKDPGARHGNAHELRDELRRVRDELCGVDQPIGKPTKRSVARKVAIGIGALVVAGAAVVMLTKFAGPGAEQMLPPAENSIGVIGFENLSDREDRDHVGRMLMGLITTDLAETGGVDVVSTSKILTSIKKAGGSLEGAFDGSLATGAARYAGARTMLAGQVIQREGKLTLTAELVDVASGRTLGSVRRDASSLDELFTLASVVASEVRNKLGIVVEDSRAPLDLAHTMTGSREAYRQFVAGEVMFHQLRFADAADRYQQAVRMDSTFAFAHFRLGMAQDWGGQTRDAEISFARSVHYKDRLPPRWQTIIEANVTLRDDPDTAYRKLQDLMESGTEIPELHNILGEIHAHAQRYRDAEKATAHFERALEFDPTFKLVSYHLVEFYLSAGQVQAVRRLVDRYRSEDPNDPLVLYGDLYLLLAERRYQDVLSRLDGANTALFESDDLRMTALSGLGDWHGAYTLADQATRGEGGYELVNAYTERAFINVGLGRFHAGLSDIDTASVMIERERGSRTVGRRSERYSQKAQILSWTDELEEAEAAAREAIRLSRYNAAAHGLLVSCLLARGEVNAADSALTNFGRMVEESFSPRAEFHLACARAVLHLVRGEVDAAMAEMDGVAEISPLNRNRRQETIVKAQALEGRGEPAAALSLYQEFFRRPGLGGVAPSVFDIPILFHMARLEERTGALDLARQHYGEYLDRWGAADIRIRQVEQAKRRLAALSAATLRR